MRSVDEILNDASSYCDTVSGEVIRRVPDELMQQLRGAKLSRGVPKLPNENTQTKATWYVFFTTEIRDSVMRRIREIRQKSRRKNGNESERSPGAPAAGKPGSKSPKPQGPKSTSLQKPTGAPDQPNVPARRGLGHFRNQRKQG